MGKNSLITHPFKPPPVGTIWEWHSEDGAIVVEIVPHTSTDVGPDGFTLRILFSSYEPFKYDVGQVIPESNHYCRAFYEMWHEVNHQ